MILNCVYKVHGGTTKADIIKFMKKAETVAHSNRKDNLDTVVFFDEANTTESLGLFKEILCDQRINGKSIPTDLRLKFIAACNPYKR